MEEVYKQAPEGITYEHVERIFNINDKDVLKKNYKIEGVNFIKQLIDKTVDGDIIMFVATEKETYECCKLLNNYNNSKPI